MTDVPCNGCTACCRKEQLILHPEMGDDPREYDCEMVAHPLSGEPAWGLRHARNGDCIYLDRATGCTIHDRRPAICREYDCRAFVKRFDELPRPERRRLLRTLIPRDVIAAGRARMHTLEKS